MKTRHLFFFALFFCAFQIHAQQQFEQVNTDELAKNPKRFWARGIVFRDILESHPESRVIKIGARSVQEVQLQKLGPCYADTVIAPALNDLKLGKEYVYAGTVLQIDKKFRIHIQGLATQVRNLETLPVQIEQAVLTASNNTYNLTFTYMTEMMNGIETDLAAYAKEKNIPVADFFNPLSTNYSITIDVTQAAVLSMTEQLKTTPASLLSDFIVAILAQRYPASTNRISPEAPKKPKRKSR